MSVKKIFLTCKSVMFYSTKDEDAFFEWVKKITCIERFWGKGNNFFIFYSKKRIDFCFHPYNGLRCSIKRGEFLKHVKVVFQSKLKGYNV